MKYNFTNIYYAMEQSPEDTVSWGYGFRSQHRSLDPCSRAR